MSKYTFIYNVSRLDSSNEEVAEEASLDFYPAKAQAITEDNYAVTHEFDAPNDEAAIACMREIIDTSALDIDIFSLSRGEETIFTEESDEDDEDDDLSDEHNFDQDFTDTDPWRGGPEGDLFG